MAVLAIAALTLTPGGGGDAQTETALCLVCGTYGGVDVVLNVLLFVPFGVGLRVLGLRPLHAMLVGLAATLAIELLQTWVVPGRDASLGDIVTNGLGTAIGVAVGGAWRTLLFPARRAARTLMGAWGALALLSLLASAMLLRPAATRGIYYGQWAPELGHFDTFRGRLLHAAINGDTFPRWMSRYPERIAAGMDRRRLHVTALVVPGAPTSRIAPIVSIFDDIEEELLVLGQEGRDLVFRFRTRVRGLRLRNPGVRLVGAFPAAGAAAGPADTLRVSAMIEGTRVRLLARGPSGTATHETTIPHAGWWSFAAPFEPIVDTAFIWLSAAWLALCAAPFGYWSVRAENRGRALVPTVGTAAVVGLSLVAGLVIAPLVVGAATATWHIWVGALAGTLLGRLLGYAIGPYGAAPSAHVAPRRVVRAVATARTSG